MKQQKEKLTAAELASGFETKNFYRNMQNFIFAFLIFCVAFLLLYIVAGFKTRLHGTLNAKVEEIKKSAFFNGNIKATHASYLQTTVSFQVYTTTLNFEKFAENWYGILPKIWPLAVIVLYPIWELTCMYYFRDRLDEPEIRSRIGEMYKNVNLNRDRNVILFRPVHLIRQACFVLIPVVVYLFDSG
jgi:hypothetical protein